MSNEAKKFVGVALVLLLLCLGGCHFTFRGPVVKVTTATVGRVKTTDGFEKKLKQPSIFRLPSNWFGMNPTKLVLAETSDNRITEEIERLFMPQDNLNLHFQIVGTFAVSDEQARIDAIYDRLTPVPVDGSKHTEVIGFEQVYKAYGEQVVRTTAQEIVAKYSIQEVMESLDPISKEIQDAVNARLADSPISVKYCGLGTVQPPQVIVQAQEKAKKRQIEIETAEAQKLVSLTIADANYQVGLKQQEIELVEAETQVLTDLVLADAVSKAYVAQRSLRVLDGLANNPNATFILSTKVFEDPASLLGLSSDTIQALDSDKEEKEAKLKEALEKIEAAKKAALEELRREADAGGVADNAEAKE